MFNLRLILVFSFLLANISLKAQQMDWSVAEKIKDNAAFTEILGQYNKYYFLVRFDKNYNQSFYFAKYNNNLQNVGSFEFKNNKNYTIEKILLLEGKILIFYSMYDKDDKFYKLYYNVLDEDFQTVSIDNYLGSSKLSSNEFSIFKIYEDKIYHRVMAFFPVESFENSATYKVIVLNKDLSVYKASKIELSYSKETSIEGINIIDDRISALINQKTPAGFFRAGKVKYQFFSFNLSSGLKKDYQLYNDTIRLNSAAYIYDLLTSSYRICGYYSLNDKEDSYGLAIIQYFPEKDSSTEKYIAFSAEMITSITGIRNTGNGLLNFSPKLLISRDDGGFIFLGEYFVEQKEFVNNSYYLNNSYTKYYYLYKDIMVVSVNPNGTIDWNKIIRKEQISLNDEGYYSSFISSTSKNKMVILFNDLTRDRYNLVLNELKPDGEINNRILVNGNNFEGTFVPRASKQVGFNELLLPSIDKNHGFVLMRLTY